MSSQPAFHNLVPGKPGTYGCGFPRRRTPWGRFALHGPHSVDAGLAPHADSGCRVQRRQQRLAFGAAEPLRVAEQERLPGDVGVGGGAGDAFEVLHFGQREVQVHHRQQVGQQVHARGGQRQQLAIAVEQRQCDVDAHGQRLRLAHPSDLAMLDAAEQAIRHMRATEAPVRYVPDKRSVCIAEFGRQEEFKPAV